MQFHFRTAIRFGSGFLPVDDGGEFILYYRGKIVGGIYDYRLLVKKTRSALELMPAAICELPYEGAKEMLLVDEVDRKEFLTKLFEAMYDELPSPKRKTTALEE